jgi:3-methyladenine DNA glycosylase AlkD
MNEKIITEIQLELKKNAPTLVSEKRSRLYKILNSQNPKFEAYGLTMVQIERVTDLIFKKYESTYDIAVDVFKKLINSNVHEEKFAGVFYLNHFKQSFDDTTIDLFHSQFVQHCDTWALCDSACIRVIGPFLAKNDQLARKTIETWFTSENVWIRRAAMVILLKIIMVKKDFDEAYVFNIVEKMLASPEEYIQKGVGWLLKTCSNYKPDVIFNYLKQHKKDFSPLVIRYASEKLSKEQRAQVLEKSKKGKK